MLLTRFLPAAGALAFAGFLLPAIAGDPAPSATPARLPLTRVTLFTAGVGYFHREGTVDGTVRVDVRVPEEDVNDLIKTLVATDAGGTARAVTYDNKAPAEVTLKAFRLDLTENPSVADLLTQARGERIEVTDKQGVTVAGTIVSLEKPEVEVSDTRAVAATGEDAGKQVTIRTLPNLQAVVNLLTDDGVEGVPLSKLKKVRFTKPELQAEFRKALEALAAAHGSATKSVGVTFAGAGKRPVSLGYVADAPLWKPTWRVNLDGAGAKVEGWAAVENTTDEDWENVKLSLVSGRPMTFQMDLYDPLYVPRPTVEPRMYASLRPPVYQASVSGPMGGAATGGAAQLGGAGFGGQIGIQGGIQGGFGGGNLGVGGGAFGVAGGFANTLARPSARGRSGPRLGYDEFRTRVTSGEAADAVPKDGRPTGLGPVAAADFGQAFRYDVAAPVSLPRFKSALVPVLSEPVTADRVSIFNPAVLANHPLLGVKLTNGTKQFLAQGPVAVYDGGTYAGDARLPDVQPGETRLLSYAIDLDVAAADETSTTRTPTRVTVGPSTVRAGNEMPRTVAVLTEETGVREVTKYRLHNRSAAPRTVLVTRPARSGWKLVSPEKPADRTPDLVRFEVKVGPGATATLDVVEETTESQTRPVADLSAEALDRYLTLPAAPAAVKAALARIKEARAKRAEAERAVADEQAAIREIAEDQTRIRANIDRVPTGSQAYQRYLKKFDDQETEIEKRQARVKELRKSLDADKQALDEFVKGLKAE